MSRPPFVTSASGCSGSTHFRWRDDPFCWCGQPWTRSRWAQLGADLRVLFG